MHLPAPKAADEPAPHCLIWLLPSHACPAGLAAHSRSDDAPGAFVSYSTPAHDLMPTHTRSAFAVGAANVYCPLGHAARCVEHSRFDDTDGAFDSHSFAWHSVSTAHAAPSSVADHVPCAPAVQAAHTRSAVELPALAWP